MLTREQYEELTGAIDTLTDRLIEMEVEKRLLVDNPKKYSDEKVRGKRVREEEIVDLTDGWD
jgi:hypothetical protein